MLSLSDLLTSRIIPALAGNTTASSTPRSRARDHPRSRGEYACFIVPLLPESGSSPLSRGILFMAFSGVEWGRIIPALAGNTAAGDPNHRAGSDHPRSRGEYQGVARTASGSRGSSPLSRGIPPARGCVVAIRRIIPALAGNTPG